MNAHVTKSVHKRRYDKLLGHWAFSTTVDCVSLNLKQIKYHIFMKHYSIFISKCRRLNVFHTIYVHGMNYLLNKFQWFTLSHTVEVIHLRQIGQRNIYGRLMLTYTQRRQHFPSSSYSDSTDFGDSAYLVQRTWAQLPSKHNLPAWFKNNCYFNFNFFFLFS